MQTWLIFFRRDDIAHIQRSKPGFHQQGADTNMPNWVCAIAICIAKKKWIIWVSLYDILHATGI